MDQKQDLFRIVESAIESVRPSTLFPKLLANPPWPELSLWIDANHRALLSLGKASITSAQSILTQFPCRDYFVVGPPDASTSGLDAARVRLGNHPIPDQRSLQAAKDAVSWLRALPADADILIVLSGGTSALLCLPADGVSFESKMKVNQLLIRSGAAIHEINSVRKHLSAVKGGQLVRELSGKRALVLVISDVIGDDLSTIGSGPFYPDPSTFLTALSVLERYQLLNVVPEDVLRRIESGVANELPETLKGSPPVPHHIVASNDLAAGQAAQAALALGYSPHVITGVSGPVEEVADRIVSLLERAGERSAFILGGEATVRVGGAGVGGRNQHLALLLTKRLHGKSITFAAIGTDGIDGNSPAAGAWIDGRTAVEAVQMGLSADTALQEFDSFHFFQKLDHTIMTGPSGTNVMDLYITLT